MGKEGFAEFDRESLFTFIQYDVDLRYLAQFQSRVVKVLNCHAPRGSDEVALPLLKFCSCKCFSGIVLLQVACNDVVVRYSHCMHTSYYQLLQIR